MPGAIGTLPIPISEPSALVNNSVLGSSARQLDPTEIAVFQMTRVPVSVSNSSALVPLEKDASTAPITVPSTVPRRPGFKD